jgi:hypothetical protein
LTTRNVVTFRRAAIAVLGVNAVAAAVLGAEALGRPERPDRASAPAVLFERAHELVSLQAASGDHAALWKAPTTDGGHCVLLHVSAKQGRRPSARRNQGGICRAAGAAAQSTPIAVTVHWLPTSGGQYEVVMQGSVAMRLGISRVELRSAAGTRALRLRAGHFLTELPSAATAGELAEYGAPYAVVGYTRDGTRVASLDVERVLASARVKS